MSYQYWVVRYVPNVARGEFVNIGIVVGGDDRDWRVRFVSSLGRAHRLGGDPSELTRWTRWFSRVIGNAELPDLYEGVAMKSKSSWISQLAVRQANTVQISQAIPIRAESAEEAMNLLFPILIESPDEQPHRSGTRRRIVSDLKDVYEYQLNLIPGKTLLSRPLAKIGRQAGRFDFAALGPQRSHLSHAWAFDTKDAEKLQQDVQSWSFLVGRIREDGALVTAGSVEARLQPEVPIHAVYRPPTSNKTAMNDVFAAALDAWRINEVKAIAIDDLIEYEGAGVLLDA